MPEEQTITRRRDAPGARRRRRRNGVVGGAMWIGRVAAALTLALVCGLCVALGVQSVIDQQGAIVWGTYTEERCEPRLRNKCHSIGTWVSDDGTVTRREVTLDGFTGPDRTARAGYRPDAVIGPDVVHTSFWIDAGPAVAFGIAVYAAAVLVGELRKWRLLRRGRTRGRGTGSSMETNPDQAVAVWRG